MKEKVEKERPVNERILKEINIIDKINQQWKEGKISEFEFSETLDRLLINLKRYQIELKQLDSQSLENGVRKYEVRGFARKLEIHEETVRRHLKKFRQGL